MVARPSTVGDAITFAVQDVVVGALQTVNDRQRRIAFRQRPLAGAHSPRFVYGRRSLVEGDAQIAIAVANAFVAGAHLRGAVDGVLCAERRAGLRANEKRDAIDDRDPGDLHHTERRHVLGVRVDERNLGQRFERRDGQAHDLGLGFV